MWYFIKLNIVFNACTEDIPSLISRCHSSKVFWRVFSAVDILHIII